MCCHCLFLVLGLITLLGREVHKVPQLFDNSIVFHYTLLWVALVTSEKV